MITIKKNGKFIIPENEVFIGHAGDNLHATKEFFVEGVTDVSLVYRMYLQFDDGSTNFFLLQSETAENGTKLIWNVTSDQIYKSGILKMQIKASNSSGVVFHSAITSLVAQTSIEFGESYKNKENSEFLQHEQFLNELIEKERSALEELKEYGAGITDGSLMDTEPTKNSIRAAQSGGIYNALKTKLDNTDGSVKVSNLSKEVRDLLSSGIEDGSITKEKLSEELREELNDVIYSSFVSVYNAGELTERTALNVPNFAADTALWQLTAGGDLAASVKGTESTFTAELRYIAPYQILTDVETQQIYVRKVNSIAPNFSADAWEEKSAGGNTTSERINITEETNDFSGSYELSNGTITVSGKISVSAGSNTGKITPSKYIPVNTMCAIGKGTSKHYIVDVATSAPYYKITVLNMDGTAPTETDTVRFTATLFKT